MSRPIDWLLLARYALLVSLCALIPVPLLDRWVENALRRRLVRNLAAGHGLALAPEAVRTLADAPSGGCLGFLWAVVVWPIKKLLKTVLFVFSVKGIADTLSEVVHRSLLLEEAIESGWLGVEPPEKIRAAMDQALAHVDTRPLERALNGSLRDGRHHLNRAIWESARIARERVRSHPVSALADAADADTLGAETRATSRAMSAALQVSGLVPELVGWFRAEMGHPPRLEPGVGGPITPEVLPADGPTEPPALPAPIEDADEVEAGSG